MEISSSDYIHLWDYIEDLTCELPSSHLTIKEEAERGECGGRWWVRFVESVKTRSPCGFRRGLLVGTKKPSRLETSERSARPKEGTRPQHLGAYGIQKMSTVPFLYLGGPFQGGASLT